MTSPDHRHRRGRPRHRDRRLRRRVTCAATRTASCRRPAARRPRPSSARPPHPTFRSRQAPAVEEVVQEASDARRAGARRTGPRRTGLVEPPVVVPEKPTFRARLGKARSAFSGAIGSIRSRSTIDQETWDDLEEALLRADVGIGPTQDLLDSVRAAVKERDITTPDALIDAVKAEMKSRLALDVTLSAPTSRRRIWLFVGVNGVGKTTTIGKVGQRMADDGTSVVMAAGDTFRAAAAEQLGTWAERCGAELIRGAEGGDPSRDHLRRRRARRPRGGRGRARRHRRAPPHQVEPHGRAGKVRRVADKGAGECHRGAAGARRHDRPERPRPGPPVHRGHRAHRGRAHEARRVGQGRHRVRDRVRAGHPGEAGRARRDRRRPRRFRRRSSSSRPCSRSEGSAIGSPPRLVALMFEALSDRFDGIFKRLRSRGRLTEAEVDEILREIRLALLEADVNVSVVRNLQGPHQGSLPRRGPLVGADAVPADHQVRQRGADRHPRRRDDADHLRVEAARPSC